MATPKTYIVKNPRGIPEGVPIFRWREPGNDEDTAWYEGDTLAPPKGLKVDRLLREGLIEVN